MIKIYDIFVMPAVIAWWLSIFLSIFYFQSIGLVKVSLFMFFLISVAHFSHTRLNGVKGIRFLWYDIWIGLYVDRKNNILYFCPFPMIIYIFGGVKEKEEIKREDIKIDVDSQYQRERFFDSPGVMKK